MKNSKITDVRWDSPAFRAGIAPGATLVAVEGREFSIDRLKDAIAAAFAIRTSSASRARRIGSARSFRREADLRES
jgi:predicted metalloprotease with PDZ domain